MSSSNWATCESCDHPHPMFIPKGTVKELILDSGEVHQSGKTTYERLLCLTCIAQLGYVSYQDRMDEMNTITEQEFFRQ